MIDDDELALPRGSKVRHDGPTELPKTKGHTGGTGTRSAGSKAGAWPQGGAPAGTEGGPDPAGQARVKGDLKEEGLETGPHAGSAV